MQMLSKVCFQEYCLANPGLLIWILPLTTGLLVLFFITVAKFKTIEEKSDFRKQRRLDRIVFLVSRSILFTLVLLALGTPYTLDKKTTPGNPSLTILVDNSTSMELFEQGIGERLQSILQSEFPVKLHYISQGTRSSIGDGILQYIQGDDNILLISDGQSNQGRDVGDIMLFSSILNTSISALRLQPIKSDVSVFIEGPTQVIERSESPFRVMVNKVGQLDAKIEVFIDGDQVTPDKNGNFNWRFSLGYHKIMARLKFSNNDHFQQNNIFYKTVKAVQRPSIMFVSTVPSPFAEALQKIYAIKITPTLPTSFDGYDLVILNNLHISQISEGAVDALSEYVSDKGKGLMVFGGDQSFDKGGYKGTFFESLLPAQVGLGQQSNKSEINLIVVMDISDSTGWSFNQDSTRLEVEKALALDVLEQINLEHNVGVIAFHAYSNLIAPLNKYVNQDLQELRTKIATLQTKPATNIFSGLFRAEQELRRRRGSKNIILISDGQDSDESSILNKASQLSREGVKIFTIGSAGEKTNKQLMEKIASISGGIYYEPDQINNIKLLFGEAPEDQCKKETMQLFLTDTTHWISRGDYPFSAAVSGYNFVVPKASGRKILATDCDRSIMIPGRYGLGRVVVMATDDGSKWAGQLLGKQNSKILTRAVNWAIGDFTKNLQEDIRVKDTFLGQSTQVNVIAQNPPEVQGLDFAKVDVGRFSATFRPSETGFFKIGQASVGVSDFEEYFHLGINAQLQDLVYISRGQMFDPNDIEGIQRAIYSLSRRVRTETVNHRLPFIIAAVIWLLIDILFRRIREYTRG